MPGPVHVRHPAAIRYVPKGGRNERLGLVSLTTPVTIPEVDVSGFDEIGRLRLGAERGHRRGQVVRDRVLHARDGSVWIGLRSDWDAPLRREALEAFLTSGAPVPPEDESDLALHFTRTPVLAVAEGFRRHRSTVEPDRVRTLAADGTDRARSDLARLIGEDVAIVAGEVRVRLRSMVCALVHPSWERRHEPSVVRPAVFPRSRQNLPCAWRLDRPAEFVEYLVANRLIQAAPDRRIHLPGQERVETYLGLTGSGPFPFDLARGGEVTLFANEAHAHLLNLTVVQEMSKLEGLPDGALRALSRSRAWDMLGSMSAIRPSEYGACLQDLRVLADAARAAHRRAANSGSIDRLTTALDGAILPAWRDLATATADASVAAEDEAALGGLVP